ncbi:hypothetical protein ACFL2Q_07955 [Thermodesulfobacteriota bacterium]
MILWVASITGFFLVALCPAGLAAEPGKAIPGKPDGTSKQNKAEEQRKAKKQSKAREQTKAKEQTKAREPTPVGQAPTIENTGFNVVIPAIKMKRIIKNNRPAKGPTREVHTQASQPDDTRKSAEAGPVRRDRPTTSRKREPIDPARLPFRAPMPKDSAASIADSVPATGSGGKQDHPLWSAVPKVPEDVMEARLPKKAILKRKAAIKLPKLVEGQTAKAAIKAVPLERASVKDTEDLPEPIELSSRRPMEIVPLPEPEPSPAEEVSLPEQTRPASETQPAQSGTPPRKDPGPSLEIPSVRESTTSSKRDLPPWPQVRTQPEPTPEVPPARESTTNTKSELPPWPPVQESMTNAKRELPPWPPVQAQPAQEATTPGGAPAEAPGPTLTEPNPQLTPRTTESTGAAVNPTAAPQFRRPDGEAPVQPARPTEMVAEPTVGPRAQPDAYPKPEPNPAEKPSAVILQQRETVPAQDAPSAKPLEPESTPQPETQPQIQPEIKTGRVGEQPTAGLPSTPTVPPIQPPTGPPVETPWPGGGARGTLGPESPPPSGTGEEQTPAVEQEPEKPSPDSLHPSRELAPLREPKVEQPSPEPPAADGIPGQESPVVKSQPKEEVPSIQPPTKEAGPPLLAQPPPAPAPPVKETFPSPLESGLVQSWEVKKYLAATTPILEELSLLMARAPSLAIEDYDPSRVNPSTLSKDTLLKMEALKRSLQILDSKTFAIIPPKRYAPFHTRLRDSITHTFKACDCIMGFLKGGDPEQIKKMQDHIIKARDLIQSTRQAAG